MSPQDSEAALDRHQSEGHLMAILDFICRQALDENLEKGLEKCTEAAQQEALNAQLEPGSIYREGRMHAKKDAVKSAYWYAQANQDRGVLIDYGLGSLYEKNAVLTHYRLKKHLKWQLYPILKALYNDVCTKFNNRVKAMFDIDFCLDCWLGHRSTQNRGHFHEVILSDACDCFSHDCGKY